MRIAFTTKGTDWDSKMDPRFGRTEHFLVFDEVTNDLVHLNNSDSSKDAHGAGPKTAQNLSEHSCNILVTGNGPGGNAATVLAKMNIEIFIGAADKTIEAAILAHQNNELKKF